MRVLVMGQKEDLPHMGQVAVAVEVVYATMDSKEVEELEEGDL